MGEVREVTELITPGPAEALAGLLGGPGAAGGELPLLWHWVYLLDRPPQAVLGPDGLTGPWARDRVYSRALTIAGGTTQVNKNIVAQRILGLPRS